MKLAERLPKPCFFEDVRDLCNSGYGLRIGLVCDGFVDDAEKAIQAWCSIASGSTVVLFAQPAFQEVLNNLKNENTGEREYHRIVNYKDIKKSLASRDIQLWATLSTYDAFGVLVKVEIEAVISGILKKNPGVFMAHNSEFGIVRCFDYSMLEDRLKKRPLRIRVYKSICYSIKIFSSIGARLFPVKKSWRIVR